MTAKRVWFKVPVKDRYYNKSQWVGRPLSDDEVTARKFLKAPGEIVGNGHSGWELYYHDSSVQELVTLLKRWSQAASGHGDSVPMSEILEVIARHEI